MRTPLFASRPAARLRRATAAAVVVVMWGLLTHGTFAGSGDEPHYQMIAHSLAFDRDLDLANNYADPANLVAGGTLDPGLHAIPGKDGRLRPVHDIGMPLLFAPYFAAAHLTARQAGASLPPALLKRAKLTEALLLRHLLSLAMIAITAWIALQVFDIGIAMGAGGARAAGVALLLALSSPLLSHSFLFFTEIVSAALALWVFRRVRAPDLGFTHPFFVGAITGLLMLVHARNAGLVGGLTILAIISLRRWPKPSSGLAWFLSGLAVLTLLRTAVTYHFWGTFITTPHAHVNVAAGAGVALGETLTRLAGWLFDQEHGLFFYAPIYLLAPAGFIALRRRDRVLTLQLACVIALYVGVMATPIVNPHGWRGGWAPAARFLVPIVPLLAYPMFAWVVPASRSILFAALVLVQVAVNAVAWQSPKVLWNEGDGTSALLTHVGGGADHVAALFPAEGRWLAPMLWAAVAVICLAWVQVRRSDDRDHR